MAKVINVEEAASWSKSELEANLTYLRARDRWSEIKRVEELTKKSKKHEEPEEDEDNPSEEPEKEPEEEPEEPKKKKGKKK